MCPEDESIIMSSFVNTMTSLSVKQGKPLLLQNLKGEVGGVGLTDLKAGTEVLMITFVIWRDFLCFCVPVEDGEVFDFRGMRLDWFRLQVCSQT